MRKIIYLLNCLLFVNHIGGNCQEMKEGAVIVKLAPNQSISNIQKDKIVNGRHTHEFVHPIGEKIFGKYHITRIERTYPGVEKYNHPNAKILRQYYTIEGDFKRDNVIYEIVKEGQDLFEDVEPVTAESPLFVPNDFSIEPAGDYHLNQVNAQQAWDFTTGNRSIKVAVTDPTGFFFNHPDYINSNGTNQILYKSPTANDQSFSQSGDHGLNVASTVAVSTNNGIGISALGFNTGLMAFKSGYNEMLHASYDHNADIVEASWINTCTFQESEQLIIDMIHDNGTIIVAAAGNGNVAAHCPSEDGQRNGLTYPASYNHVISVGGVDGYDKYLRNTGGANLSHFTFNEAVDVTAPAWNVKAASVLYNSDYTFQKFDYRAVSGTSIAAPMVAGLAALILSINPDITPNVAEHIIKSTAVNVDGIAGNEIYAGKGGTGRIDAYAAVNRAYNCYGCINTTVFPAPNFPIDALGCKLELHAGTINSGQNASYTMTRAIIIQPGFHAAVGSNVQLKISPECGIPEGSYNNARIDQSLPIQHVRYADLIASGQIQIPEDAIEEEYAELSNYPNPVANETTIKFSLLKSSFIKLVLKDISGKVIDIIIDGDYQEAGNYELQYDVSNLSPGVYYYTLESNDANQTKRLVVIRK